MQEAFDSFRSFDFDGADVRLWVFKNSSTDAKYNAFFVRTDEALDCALKRFARKEQARISEWNAYSYIAQTNECSCLCVDADKTNFAALKALVDRPEVDHAIQGVKNLRGVVGYLVKYVKGDEVVYAVRRSPQSWKAQYRKKGVINVVFKDGYLSAIPDDEFTLDPDFDFFSSGSALLIAKKAGFESVMRYKAAYAEAFSELQGQQEFVALFTDVKPLVEYVGANSMQLRRMAVIQEKSLYANPGFLAALKTVNDTRNWGIQFDTSSGLIIPDKETAALIIRILLDQRLLSEITNIMYDVPDAVKVE